MKMKRIQYLIVLSAISLLFLTQCTKDNTSTPAANGLTSQQVAQVQNSDAQDAVADQTEQDIDVTADELQNGSYQTENMTSGRISGGTRTITVDHPDSTSFPKMVTIVYNNWSDSTADERFVKNGEIDITVNATDPKHRLISRSFTFKNFSVATDSTTITVSGTRTVQREKDSIYWNLNTLKARLAVTDNITANLSFAITTTGVSDSMKFTRIVDRTRTAISWYQVSVRNHHLFGRHLASGDTITYTGSVTGVNEKGLSYSKQITKPITINLYKGTLVLTSGTIDYTGGTGDTAFSFEITYKQDLPSHPHKTLVTITNTLTGKSTSFVRRISRKFLNW